MPNFTKTLNLEKPLRGEFYAITKHNENSDKIDLAIEKITVPTIEHLQNMIELQVGDIVDIQGYYAAGDGAHHKRKIATTDDGSGVQLANGLWANIIHNGEVDVSWFGAKKTVSFDNHPIFAKALKYAKVKFDGEYEVRNTITFTDNYYLVGKSSETSIIKRTQNTAGAIILFSKPYELGQNLAARFCTLKNIKLLGAVNTEEWQNDTIDRVETGLGSSSYGVAESVIENIKIKGCKKATDIKEGWLNVFKNMRAERCNNGFNFTGGTSYDFGILSLVDCCGILFNFENVFYSRASLLVADYCKSSKVLNFVNSQISVDSVGLEIISDWTNIYNFENSEVTIGNTKYIQMTPLNSSSVFYNSKNSCVKLLTENQTNAGWGAQAYSVTNSDFELGNILNFRKKNAENVVEYRVVDLNTLKNIREYGRIFVTYTSQNLPAPGSFMVDYISTTNDITTNGDGSTQTATSLSTGYVYNRRYNGTTWSPWRRIDNTSSVFSTLDTPYYALKMQQEGVYEDYVVYRDELHEYEKAQWQAVEGFATMNELVEPQPSQALLDFKKKYLG